MAQTQTAELSNKDRKFMTEAAHTGKAEIEAARMALSKSNNDQIQQFARTMLDDHTEADEELTELAENKGVTLPDEPNEDQQEQAAELKEYSGDEFDAEYMSQQIEAHQTAIDLFKDEIDGGSDRDAVAFAEKTLPKLKNHLDMAESIYDNL
jgi:putative membrane protein